MLVAAGLLSSSQLAEATPDAGVLACEMSVRKVPTVAEGRVVTSGASSGCPHYYRFEVSLEYRNILGQWWEKGDDFWSANDRGEASTLCTHHRTPYRGIVYNHSTGKKEISDEKVIAC
ncbi:hypothetical protein ALI144C_09240 [Actinosynnema sp. ALI-1.44]|nr:hypothetical protein ALI144C_09240 [Actinosynnema sp. ALI-1.44]